LGDIFALHIREVMVEKADDTGRQSARRYLGDGSAEEKSFIFEI